MLTATSTERREPPWWRNSFYFLTAIVQSEAETSGICGTTTQCDCATSEGFSLRIQRRRGKIALKRLRCALLKNSGTLWTYSKTLCRPLHCSSATFLVHLGNKWLFLEEYALKLWLRQTQFIPLACGWAAVAWDPSREETRSPNHKFLINEVWGGNFSLTLTIRIYIYITLLFVWLCFLTSLGSRRSDLIPMSSSCFGVAVLLSICLQRGWCEIIFGWGGSGGAVWNNNNKTTTSLIRCFLLRH